MARLEGKTAVVTGAASGIGRATVETFVHEGANVIIADIQDDKGAALAHALGDAALYQRTDVNEEDEIKAAVDLAVSRFGRLDVMFNNAGAPGVSGSILELDADAFDSTVALLLRSVALGIKHAGRVMVEQGSGSIISTASVAGIRGGFGPHIYAACKAAVINLTRSVGQELAEKSVRVNCICPGGIATAIFGAALEVPSQLHDAAAEAIKPMLAQMQAVPRAGLAEDIANAALYLASDDASFVSGHALVVDGGLTSGGIWSQQQDRRQTMRAKLSQLQDTEDDQSIVR